MSGFGWPDAVGIVGVAAILIAYFGLQLGRIDSRSPAYSIANAIGAALVLVSLAFEFNLSAFMIECFWLLISLVGLVRSMRRRLRPRPAE